MKTIFDGGLKVAAVGGMVLLAMGARAGKAAITLQETVEPIDARLEAAGWMGVKLTLVADEKSWAVGGIDLNNNQNLVRGVLDPVTGLPVAPVWLFPAGEMVGISGPVHQAWSVAGDEIDDTTTGNLDVSDGATDSFFMHPSSYLMGDPFAEDNNLLASGEGNDSSPLMDTGETVYGVGSAMTFAGGVIYGFMSQTKVRALYGSFDVAFLIVPAGMNNVYFRGQIIDEMDDSYTIDQVVNPAGLANVGADATVAPEAGTVGVGVVMAGVVLVRRKRRRISQQERGWK